MQRAVDETGTAVILNTALDRGEHRALTDLVIAPGRRPIAAYDKQHLYESERSVFTAGPGGFSFTLNGTELALSVCYDANFPEHAAAAAANGATAYINSGAYFPGGADRRDLHYAARALDNGIYVVFSGLIGAPSDFIGGSAIFDPLGRRIASVPTVEGIAIAEIDPDVVVRAREHQRMWMDRRASLGGHTHHGAIAEPPRVLAQPVTVPDVVGLPFHVGRDVAAEARVALANPDSDGPPISSLAWPGLYYIVSQDPAPGTVVKEWDSVAVEIVEHGDGPDREPATRNPAPPTDAAHADDSPD